MAVHDRGYLIAAGPAGAFTFHDPHGAPVPPCPPLPEPDGGIADVHDADITPETIIPPWHGERLDLDHAIYVCLANGRLQEDRAAGRDAAVPAEPGFVPGPCVDPYCPYCPSRSQPSARSRRYAPVQIPIPYDQPQCPSPLLGSGHA